MKTVTVKPMPADNEPYDIYIEPGIIESALGEILKRFPQRNPFIVTDTNLVKTGQLDKLLKGRDVPCFVIDPPGEVSKHIHTVIDIINAMEKDSLGRDTVIIALGGGTVGDIAGFAAAIFKRSVPHIQIPTTTVAQADSSVGGKTGVDSSLSKNAFGAFFQPRAVYIDPETLLTLDRDQYLAGLTESVKHALVMDKDYFAYLEENADRLIERDIDAIEHIACENCRIKACVVEQDPTEKNLRSILNYGHTIGHAVESQSGYEMLHGQAVAVGITAAGLIEIETGLQRDSSQLERIKKLLEKFEQPLKIPAEFDTDKLMETVARDKKSLKKRARFVLLESIGKTLCRKGTYTHEVDEKIVRSVIEKMKS